MRNWLFLAISWIILVQAQAAGLSLDVRNGKLKGVAGLNVNGFAYNVEFVDGTCADVYGNGISCAPSSFSFITKSDADTAVQALLNQVFASPFDYYDEHPEEIFGCGYMRNGQAWCNVYVPYAVEEEFVWMSFVSNRNSFDTPISGNPDYASDSSVSVRYYISTDSAQSNEMVWSVWTLASVPEPSTYALMAIGFAGLAATYRRTRGNPTGLR